MSRHFCCRRYSHLDPSFVASVQVQLAHAPAFFLSPLTLEVKSESCSPPLGLVVSDTKKINVAFPFCLAPPQFEWRIWVKSLEIQTYFLIHADLELNYHHLSRPKPRLFCGKIMVFWWLHCSLLLLKRWHTVARFNFWPIWFCIKVWYFSKFSTILKSKSRLN